MKYDVIIVGAGPGGIFSSYELVKLNPNLKIAVFEAGYSLEKRRCPIDGEKVKACIRVFFKQRAIQSEVEVEVLIIVDTEVENDRSVWILQDRFFHKRESLGRKPVIAFSGGANVAVPVFHGTLHADRAGITDPDEKRRVRGFGLGFLGTCFIGLLHAAPKCFDYGICFRLCFLSMCEQLVRWITCLQIDGE